jgi:short-subunit dehydrogenase
MKNQKVVLITGASSGIGKETSVYLAKKGLIVVGTSRLVERLEEVEVEGGKIYLYPLELRSPTLILSTTSKIIKQFGKIDILINNAGAGLAGPIEDTSYEEMVWQFEVNFFGHLRVIKAVLPYMRERNEGMIIFISSLAAEVGLPFQGLYSASKAAINRVAESLQMECPFLKVVVIEPSDYKTSFPENRRFVNVCDSYYLKNFKKAIEEQEKHERQGSDPKEIAELIWKIIKDPKKFYYPIGKNARTLTILGKVVPHRLLLKEVMKYYGL